MLMDTLILSRIQFASNISFHILFPTITIAMGWFLLFFKLRYTKSKDERWMDLYFLFTKIFALSFALGVVSGVTMSFQFGTNWPGFMNKVGNIAGPLLAYEVLTAFFLEATFLAVMLFGFRKVKPWVHSLATFLVAFGTTLSAFWILALNSWMHTPDGYEIIDGVVYAQDWLKIIFNPSMPYRVAHMLIASFLTSGFLIIGVLSYKWLKGQRHDMILSGLKSILILMAILGPLQVFVGDYHGLNTLKHQPQKVAAMEGAWKTEKGLSLVLFAVPDEEEKRNKYEIKIPKLASLILTHDLEGEIKGLEEFEGNHPPVAPVFFAFRIMVACSFVMIFASFVGCYFVIKKKILPNLLAKIYVLTSFIGWVALIAGWYVTEIGRQPWLVSGILKTKDAVTNIAPENVQLTLVVYSIIYLILLAGYVRTVFYLARK